MMRASPLIHQHDRVARKVSDVSVADWWYQSCEKLYIFGVCSDGFSQGWKSSYNSTCFKDVKMRHRHYILFVSFHFWTVILKLFNFESLVRFWIFSIVALHRISRINIKIVISFYNVLFQWFISADKEIIQKCGAWCLQKTHPTKDHQANQVMLHSILLHCILLHK